MGISGEQQIARRVEHTHVCVCRARACGSCPLVSVLINVHTYTARLRDTHLGSSDFEHEHAAMAAPHKTEAQCYAELKDEMMALFDAGDNAGALAKVRELRALHATAAEAIAAPPRSSEQLMALERKLQLVVSRHERQSTTLPSASPYRRSTIRNDLTRVPDGSNCVRHTGLFILRSPHVIEFAT